MSEISVIVPVYRVEAYLRRCVDSVLSQTFSDLELILIDDGSPDRCPEICDEYAVQDSRVHVIHQKNQGLSAARNAALDYLFAQSGSSWLTFLDSDDWIHPQFLELLVQAARRQSVRLAICNHQRTNGDIAWGKYEREESVLWSAEEYYIAHNLNATIACAKLYHKSCFEHIRFPVGKVHEDEYTTYQILFGVQKAAVVDLPLYAYYSNPQSITTSGNKLKWLHALSAFEEQLGFFKAIGAEKAYSYRMANYYIELVLFPRQLTSAEPQEREVKRSLRKKRKEMYSQMTAEEKRMAYQYLYPRMTTLCLRITRLAGLLKEGGIASVIEALKKRA